VGGLIRERSSIIFVEAGREDLSPGGDNHQGWVELLIHGHEAITGELEENSLPMLKRQRGLAGRKGAAKIKLWKEMGTQEDSNNGETKNFY